ncbi:hypothetical protein P3X46_030684 [Hevea brasiliensis]|uniref:Uncharacterized protein n=1 Tax=Hevea brasiliensis TaxID=3981 RepID=A0ABQ9KKY8_HEVBR|nr:hypothetical protein P3X46_030684 [Hevea brasiliensis]
MKDSIDELQQALVGMRDIEGPDFEMKMSNIQTWVRNAMNGKFKDPITSYIERIGQLTSNALALIDKLVN